MCTSKKMNKLIFLKKITAVAAGILIAGCAGSPKPEPVQTVFGKWQRRTISADGSKTDWTGAVPQYSDSQTDAKIWVSNDAEQICLLAEVKNPGMARQLTRDGIILSMETGEKDAKPFSIRLKGHAPPRPRKGSGRGRDGGAPRDTPAPPAGTPNQPPAPMPDVRLPDTLVVTYPFSSGPVTMSVTEARAAGIALGLADAGRGTLIFEAVIRLDAIFFDVPRTAGTVMHIALAAGDRSSAMKRRGRPGGSKNDRTQGGLPGQGAGKPGKRKQAKEPDNRFRAAVKLTLAGSPESPAPG